MLISFWDDMIKHDNIQEFDERAVSEVTLYKKYCEAGATCLNLGSAVNKEVKDKLGKNDTNIFQVMKDTVIERIIV